MCHHWLGLVIGNSRWHWAWFEKDNLQHTWNTNHLDRVIDSAISLSGILPSEYQQLEISHSLPIYLASVVPGQTNILSDYPQIRQIILGDIPLSNTYPTFGIDRALAVFGAGESYGYPCLVIDGGTALTFTGASSDRNLVGGAILPGLRSQLTTLNQKTAALPQVELPAKLPPLWALDTEEAIASGVIRTILSGIETYIENWRDRFPHSAVVFTGGDGQKLFSYLTQLNSPVVNFASIDSNLMFWGLRSLWLKE